MDDSKWYLGNEAGGYVQPNGHTIGQLNTAKQFDTKEDAQRFRKGVGILAGLHVYGPHGEDADIAQ